MRRILLCISLALFAAGGFAAVHACAAPAAPAAEQSYLDKLPPLIDRDLIFGDPEISGGQVSPDGKHISFRKPYKDVLNIWVKEFDEPFDAARPVTADTTRPVRGYFWSRDSRYILYVQDKGGDENFHVYAVDPAAKLAPGQDVPEARDLTPYAGIRAAIYDLPKKEPDIIIVGLNDRDQRYHDVYRISISSGARTLVKQNDDEIAGWVFDLESALRLATRETADGGTEIFRLEGDAMVPIYACSNEETVNPIQFHKDGKRLYIDTNKGNDIDLSRLMLLDVSTGAVELVESDPEQEVDFGGAVFSDLTNELIATVYVGDRLRIYFKEKDWEKDYKKLKKKLPDGDIYIGSMTKDERILIVSVTSDTDPGAAYVFNRDKGAVDFLYRPRPKLPVKDLAPMKPIRYQSRDGYMIHGYLTVPKGVKAKSLPVVFMIHGGPWARDMWGYDGEAQFLANRGYAVMQPNFRGSSGYGKNFLNAAKKRWGEEMQNDITDGVKHLIDKGIADPKKVVIYGGSYGGYATLAGLAFTPELYAAGVDYVGPSSLITLLSSIPPYWETVRKYFNEHVGDPNDPEDAARLKRQSPLFSADKIRVPLLVVQGANDPRVKKAEADQIVVALRDRGHAVEYIVAPDEGHGFAGVENRTAFYVAMEKFLAKHIGGRYQESVPDDIAKRLEEITVDISTVSLPQAAPDKEKAETAPLPAVDASLLKPATLKYKTVYAVGGQSMTAENTTVIEKAMLDKAPVWRVTGVADSPQGTAIDTFMIDEKSLVPRTWVGHMGPAFMKLLFGDAEVKGEMSMGGPSMPVNVSLKAPVFAGGSSIELAVSALPLAEGYETTVRVFEIMEQKVRPMLVTVAGRESITVPAGAFDAFKVEMKPLDGDPGNATLYVSVKDRLLVRGVYEMSPAQGGGTATVELQGMK